MHYWWGKWYKKTCYIDFISRINMAVNTCSDYQHGSNTNAVEVQSARHIPTLCVNPKQCTGCRPEWRGPATSTSHCMSPTAPIPKLTRRKHLHHEAVIRQRNKLQCSDQTWKSISFQPSQSLKKMTWTSTCKWPAPRISLSDSLTLSHGLRLMQCTLRP